jgi:hypothetical protein
MASLKDVKSGPMAERLYVAKRFIYLESPEDVQFFADRWFIDSGERVEFLAAGDDSGGGCNQVLSKVREDRENEIMAFGIVDRDALASNKLWDSFFESDDDRFRQLNPFGDHVFVLRCWEVENYLLHPEVIEEFVADDQGRKPRPPQEVLEDLFNLICPLIVIVATDLLLNSYGQKCLSNQFGCNQSINSILDSTEKKLCHEVSPEVAELLEECVGKILKFLGVAEGRSLDNWLNLLRILDGKKVIHWLENHYQLGHRDIRWHLARKTKDRGKVADMLDREIFELVYGSDPVPRRGSDP